MQKKWIPVILMGMLILTGYCGAWAEELTGELYDGDNGLKTEADFDSSAEDVSPDLEEIGSSSVDVTMDEGQALQITEEPLTGDEEILLSSDELPVLVQRLTAVAAEYLQTKQGPVPGDMDLPEAGSSSNKAAAHTALKNYIQSKGKTDRSNQKYIGIVTKENGYTREIAVYYDASDDSFEFYFTMEMEDGSQGAVSMIVPVGMPDAVSVSVGAFETVDDQAPSGVSNVTISSPGSYRGNEALSFSVSGGFYGVSNTEIQKFSNMLLQAGFEGWAELVTEAGETMRSLGFTNYGASPAVTPAITPTVTPAVTSLSKPVITGYYNSVKGGDIRWSKVPNAAGYYIYRNRAAEGGNKLIATIPDGSTTQYYDGDIKDDHWGCVYAYTVVAFNGSVKSPVSTAVTLQRLAPMKFNGYQRPAPGVIMLRWACTVSSNKALGYELQYAMSTSDLYNRTGTFKTVSINGRNNVIATLRGLKSGGKYYFRVRCYVNYTHSVTGKTTKTWSQYSTVVSLTAK